MRLGRLALAGALAVGLAACGVSVSSINHRPDQYYQKKVEITGRITRTQQLPGTLLLELADAKGARILVRATPPIDAETGDWIEVEGVLVPETRVEDTVVYDVVVAEKVSRTHGPRLPPNLM